jgi:hypothetical protein
MLRCGLLEVIASDEFRDNETREASVHVRLGKADYLAVQKLDDIPALVIRSGLLNKIRRSGRLGNLTAHAQ